jgi:hypothetical protein
MLSLWVDGCFPGNVCIKMVFICVNLRNLRNLWIKNHPQITQIYAD